MKVLVGCEESQTVTQAFRDAGHLAYSCDLEPTRGNKNWHWQRDITEVIPLWDWDLIILHPSCDALAVSGNRWYGKNMRDHDKRKEAIAWTLDLWELAKRHSPRVALENPVSVIFSHLPNVHYLQPWEHGHGETKKTGFALHGLEPLKPTNVVEGREQRVWKMGPSPTRKRDRSKTFEGIALAMANQWGS
jgi:hypothetical protein